MEKSSQNKHYDGISREGKMVTEKYKLDVQRNNPLLYDLAENIVGVLPNPRLILGYRDERRLALWSPWEKLSTELRDLSGMLDSLNRPEVYQVYCYFHKMAGISLERESDKISQMLVGESPKNCMVYEFATFFPIIAYVYAHSSMHIMKRMAESNTDIIFLMSDAISEASKIAKLPYFCDQLYFRMFSDYYSMPIFQSLAAFRHVAPPERLEAILNEKEGDHWYLERFLQRRSKNGDTGWVDVAIYALCHIKHTDLAYMKSVLKEMHSESIKPSKKLQELFDILEIPEVDQDLVAWMAIALYLGRGDQADSIFLANADMISRLIDTESLHRFEPTPAGDLLRLFLEMGRYEALRKYLGSTEPVYLTFSCILDPPSSNLAKLFTMDTLLSSIFSKNAWSKRNEHGDIALLDDGNGRERREIYLGAFTTLIDAGLSPTPLCNKLSALVKVQVIWAFNLLWDIALLCAQNGAVWESDETCRLLDLTTFTEQDKTEFLLRLKTEGVMIPWEAIPSYALKASIIAKFGSSQGEYVDILKKYIISRDCEWIVTEVGSNSLFTPEMAHTALKEDNFRLLSEESPLRSALVTKSTPFTEKDIVAATTVRNWPALLYIDELRENNYRGTEAEGLIDIVLRIASTRPYDPKVDPLLTKLLYRGYIPGFGSLIRMLTYYSETNALPRTIPIRRVSRYRLTLLRKLMKTKDLDYLCDGVNPLCHLLVPSGFDGHYLDSHSTMISDNVEMVYALLRNGVDIDSSLGGTTALIEACRNSNTKMITLLLEEGANPELCDVEGNRAIDVAKSNRIRRILTNKG